MNISNELKNTINLANIELEKIANFVQENENALCNSMNLKLHDLSYYCCTQFENDFPLWYSQQSTTQANCFDWFCEDGVMFFDEWYKENSIDFEKMRNSIGSTSSFYLDDNEKFIELDKHNLDFNCTIENIINYEYGTMQYTYIDKIIVDNKININYVLECLNTLEDGEEIEENYLCCELVEVLETIQNDCYNSLFKSCQDVLKVYEYIQDFKTNSIVNFKDNAQYHEEELKAEQEKEEKEILQHNSIIDKIISKVENILNDEELSKVKKLYQVYIK